MGVAYRLHAIFSSLQGEGRNAGRPASFIRFASCNLACAWCDTHKNIKLTASMLDIKRKLEQLGNRSVIITGGEPTIQPGIDELLATLKESGYWLALETNGLQAPGHPELYDYISVSPKADYAHRYREGSMIRRADEVRVVAVTEEIAPFCRNIRKMISATDYYISPLDEHGRIHYRRALHLLEKTNKLSPELLPPWALSIQVHKVLGLR